MYRCAVNTPVGMVNAETAFIAEKHVLPANIVPVEVALRPLQACLSMAHAELHTKCVTANSGFTWTASALMRIVASAGEDFNGRGVQGLSVISQLHTG
nr:hypothetical protein BaRGS_026050 [Batillaria attramentaria]